MRELMERARLAWRLLTARDGNLQAHVRREVAGTGMEQHLLDVARVFSLEGHSGFSAAFASSALHRLLDYQPLRPLQGDAGEWIEVADGLWQNRRCSRVFRNAAGAYDIQGVVFREPNGTCYTFHKSRVPVTFPYYPTTRYVDVDEHGVPS